MSANLKSFLVDLALNSEVMHSYTHDPHGTMARAGLSADEQAAVLSGDSVRLRTALGKRDNDCMSQVSSRQTVLKGSLVRLDDGTLMEIDEDVRDVEVCDPLGLRRPRSGLTASAQSATVPLPKDSIVKLPDGTVVKLKEPLPGVRAWKVPE